MVNNKQLLKISMSTMILQVYNIKQVVLLIQLEYILPAKVGEQTSQLRKGEGENYNSNNCSKSVVQLMCWSKHLCHQKCIVSIQNCLI